METTPKFAEETHSENVSFYLKELEMESQWERKQQAEADGTAAGDDPGRSALSQRELRLALQQEADMEPELTMEEQSQLLARAGALYGVWTEIEDQPPQDSEELPREMDKKA